MKLSLLALAAVAGLASSQCVSSIPECAQDCLMIAAGSVGCSETDYACQCTSQHQTDITTNATTCVLAACGEQVALNEVLPAADAFCSAINAGESCSSASAGVTSTAASSSSGSTSSPSVSLLPTSDSPTGTGAGATATTESSSSASGTAETTESSGTGTATDASASASSTAGAASVGSVGSLGLAVLGALAML